MVLEPQVVALQTYDMKAQGWPTKGANAIAKLKIMPQYTHHLGRVQITDYFTCEKTSLRKRD